MYQNDIIFQIDVAVFGILCYLYLKNDSRLHSRHVQAVALCLIAHLCYVHFYGENNTEVGLDVEKEQPEPLLEEEALGTATINTDEISAKWYEGNTTTDRYGAQQSPSNTRDFWSTIVGSSLTNHSVPLCTRSFSSYNPHHNQY